MAALSENKDVDTGPVAVSGLLAQFLIWTLNDIRSVCAFFNTIFGQIITS